MCNGKDTPNSRNSQPALRETNFPSFKVVADMSWLKWIIKISAWGRAFTTSMNQWMNMWGFKRTNQLASQDTFLKCTICKLKGKKLFRCKWMDLFSVTFETRGLWIVLYKLLLSVSFDQAHILRLFLICTITVLDTVMVFKSFTTKQKFFKKHELHYFG